MKKISDKTARDISQTDNELEQLLEDVISPIVKDTFEEIVKENEEFKAGTEALKKIRSVNATVDDINNKLPDDIEEITNGLSKTIQKAVQNEIGKKMDALLKEEADRMKRNRSFLKRALHLYARAIRKAVSHSTNGIHRDPADVEEVKNNNPFSDNVNVLRDVLHGEINSAPEEKLRISGEAAQKDFETMKVFLWGLVAVAGCGLICNLVLLFLYLR